MTSGGKGDEGSHGQCTDLRAIFNVVLSAIGMGVVMLPTVMARCGVIGGVLILTAGGIVASFSASHLYYAIVGSPPGKPVNTFEDLADVCYGKWGRYICALIVHFTMTGIDSALLLLLGDNTHKLIPSLGKNLWVIIWAVCLTPLCFLKSMHEVSYVSAFGMVSILALFIVLVSNGITTAVTTEEEIVYDLFVFDLLEIGTCFGTCILSYNITNAVATLVRDMKNPSHFVRVCNLGYVLIYGVYVGIGVAGYLGYGRGLVSAPIMDSIVPPGEEVSSTWGYLMIATMICSSMPHYVVLLLPIASSFEYALGIDINDSSRSTTIKMCCARMVVVLITVVVACVVPNVQSLLDILGAFTMVIMGAILPFIFYIRVRTFTLGSLKAYISAEKGKFIMICVILVWSIPMMVLGSIGAIASYGEVSE